MLSVETFTSLDQFPAAFVRAAGYAQRLEIFESIEWFRCLQDSVFAGDSTPIVHVAHAQDGLPVGFLACLRPGGQRYLRSLTNYYSLDYRPVYFGDDVRGGGRAVFIDSLIGHIAQARPTWPQIRLDLLRSDRDDAQMLMSSLRSRRFLPKLSRQYENWFLRVEGASFEEYFGARSSQLRNTIARKEKKARKSHNLETAIYTRSDSRLPQAIEEYIRIYNSSWKRPEPYPRFIPAFIQLCAELGILRLGLAYLDGRAVAAQLWVNSGDRAIIYKLAYDETVAELSIGAILSRELFRNAIDVDRVNEIDYGVGSEPYKREWMSDVRYLSHLEAFRLTSFRGLMRLGRAAAGGIVGRLGRRGEPGRARKT